jgi:hypothetical protein
MSKLPDFSYPIINTMNLIITLSSGPEIISCNYIRINNISNDRFYNIPVEEYKIAKI